MKRRIRFGEAVTTKTELKSKAKACGSHFFDRDAMRFFRSRLGDVIPNPADNSTLFVTSEQFVPSSGPAHPRRYTVHQFKNCKTSTIGEFQQYGSLAEARRAARKLVGSLLGRGARRR